MGFFQRFKSVLEPADPVRSIGKVNPAEGLLSSPSRLSADALVGKNVIGSDLLAQILQSKGINIDPTMVAGESTQYEDVPQTQAARNAALMQAFPGYTFDWKDTGEANTGQLTMYDPQGNQAGSYGQQDESTGTSLMNAGMLAAAGFGGLGLAGMGPLGGLLGGAGGGAAAAGSSGAAGGGAIGSSVAGAGLEAQAAIEAYLAANPVTVGGLMAGVPEIGAITAAASAVPSFTSGMGAELQGSIADYAGSLTPQQVSATMPDIGGLLGAAPSVPAEFRPSVDSQAYNQSAGITGQQAANAATVPKTVNLVNAGGTMATAGGLSGLASLASQGLRDLTASSQIGGGLLSQAGSMGAGALDTVGSGIGSAASWAANNRGLAKALLGGAGALLSTQGGGSSGGAPKQYGAPVQWKSPVAGIPQGLLGGGQQQAQGNYPAAMGLLGGQQNSGAWRFLR